MPNCRSWFAVDATAFSTVTSRVSAFMRNMTWNSSIVTMYSCTLRFRRCRTTLCRSLQELYLCKSQTTIRFGLFHQCLIRFKRSTSSQSGFSSIGRIWRSYHWTRMRTSYNSLTNQNIRFKNAGRRNDAFHVLIFWSTFRKNFPWLGQWVVERESRDETRIWLPIWVSSITRVQSITNSEFGVQYFGSIQFRRRGVEQSSFVICGARTSTTES